MTEPAFDPFSNKPDISATSRKLYLYNLTKLNGGKAVSNLKFLSNADLLDKINEAKPNTRRTYLISVVSALKDRPEAKFKKLYAKFYEQLVNLNKELKDNTEKTPKVKENWVEQGDVKEIQQKLHEIIPKIQNKKKVSPEEYDELLRLVVLSLYTLQAPRRNKDYVDMSIVKKVPADTEHNYLDISEWKWIFNNYKTEKTYKQKVVDIPEDLKDILKVYLKFHPDAKELKKKSPEKESHFLMKADGTGITTSTDMTRMLNKIFGKKVGCSMLRSIFLTDKYGKMAEEMKDDAGAMGTSTDVMMTNYIKQE
jgi:integrase